MVMRSIDTLNVAVPDVRISFVSHLCYVSHRSRKCHVLSNVLQKKKEQLGHLCVAVFETVIANYQRLALSRSIDSRFLEWEASGAGCRRYHMLTKDLQVDINS